MRIKRLKRASQRLSWAFLFLAGFISAAWANCQDSIADYGFVKPIVERYWAKLQAQAEYPWGKLRPYGRIEGKTIVLTPDFDHFSKEQKKQVIQLLPSTRHSDVHWPDLMTPEERKVAEENYSASPLTMGYSPFDVLASDGRIIWMALDGCDSSLTFTEYERANISHMGRNIDYPRKIRYPLKAALEKKVQHIFWKAVGQQQRELVWIAWVPERGYFEIDAVGRNYQARLKRFLQIAPRGFRYVVVDEGGAALEERLVK